MTPTPEQLRALRAAAVAVLAAAYHAKLIGVDLAADPPVRYDPTGCQSWYAAGIAWAGTLAVEAATDAPDPTRHHDMRTLADMWPAWLTQRGSGTPHASAAALLRSHRDAIAKLAAALLKQPVMSGEEACRIIGYWAMAPTKS